MRHIAWAVTIAVLLDLHQVLLPAHSQQTAHGRTHLRSARQPAAAEGGPPQAPAPPEQAIVNLTVVAPGTSCPVGLTAEPQVTQICVATSKLEGLAADTPLVSNLVLISASSTGQQAGAGCTTPPCLTTCPPGYELVEGPPLNITAAGQVHVCAAFAAAGAATRSSLVTAVKMSEPRFCSEKDSSWTIVATATSTSSSADDEQRTPGIVGPLPQQPVLCQQRVDPAGVTAVGGTAPLLRLHPSRWGYSHCLQRAAASANLSAAAQVGLCPTSSCSSSWTSATTLAAVAVQVQAGVEVARVHSLWHGKHPAPLYTLRVGGHRSLQCLALDPAGATHGGGRHSTSGAQQTGGGARRQALQAVPSEVVNGSSSGRDGGGSRGEAHHGMPVAFVPCAEDQAGSLLQQVWSILPHPQVPGTVRVVSRAAHKNTSHHRCLHLVGHVKHPSVGAVGLVAGSCRGPGATWVMVARSFTG